MWSRDSRLKHERKWKTSIRHALQRHSNALLEGLRCLYDLENWHGIPAKLRILPTKRRFLAIHFFSMLFAKPIQNRILLACVCNRKQCSNSVLWKGLRRCFFLKPLAECSHNILEGISQLFVRCLVWRFTSPTTSYESWAQTLNLAIDQFGPNALHNYDGLCCSWPWRASCANGKELRGWHTCYIGLWPISDDGQSRNIQLDQKIPCSHVHDGANEKSACEKGHTANAKRNSKNMLSLRDGDNYVLYLRVS